MNIKCHECQLSFETMSTNVTCVSINGLNANVMCKVNDANSTTANAI